MTKPTITTDVVIRTMMKARLARRHAADPDAFVVEELPIGRGDGRLDLAVINGRIEGVEIKSCSDTLDRLPRQVRLYGEGADLMTLVVSSRHLEQARTIGPDWWKIFEVKAGVRGGLTLRRVQTGWTNPDRTSSGYLRLLERNELLSVLTRHGLDKGLRSASWPVLADRAAEKLPLSTIASEVRRQLKIRVLIEARFSRTAFGALATGGGTSSSTLLDGPLTAAPPAG